MDSLSETPPSTERQQLTVVEIAQDIRTEIIDRFPDLPEQLRPIAHLMLYNLQTQTRHATFSEKQKLEDQLTYRLTRLQHQETFYAQQTPILPPIGPEIELSDRNFDSFDTMLFALINLPTQPETDIRSDLLEIAPQIPFSSPTSLGRLFQELFKYGVVPSQYNQQQRLAMQADDAISMHLNFGAPLGLTRANILDNQDDLRLITDLLVYSYTSPNRIRNRKTTASYSAKNTEVVFPQQIFSENINAETGLRIEIRALEWKDYPTYKLAYESQAILAIWFSQLRSQYNLGTTPQDKYAQALWQNFQKDYSNLISKYHLLSFNLYDSNSEDAAQLIETTDISTECRHLTNYYAQALLVDLPNPRQP